MRQWSVCVYLSTKRWAAFHSEWHWHQPRAVSSAAGLIPSSQTLICACASSPWHVLGLTQMCWNQFASPLWAKLSEWTRSSPVWRLCSTAGTTQGSHSQQYNQLCPLKLRECCNFLNQSNCNRYEMIFYEQTHPQLKHQVPALGWSWLPKVTCITILHMDNAGRCPQGDMAKVTNYPWFLWINKALLNK